MKAENQATNLLPVEIMVPLNGFLRLDQVLTLIPISKTTWWDGIREGRYPRSVKLSDRTTAWRVEDIIDLIHTISSHGADKK